VRPLARRMLSLLPVVRVTTTSMPMAFSFSQAGAAILTMRLLNGLTLAVAPLGSPDFRDAPYPLWGVTWPGSCAASPWPLARHSRPLRRRLGGARGTRSRPSPRPAPRRPPVPAAGASSEI
jgi:hypothetical protein